MNPMLNGFVSEFDPTDGVGLIEANNGDLIFFNASNLDMRQLPTLDVGSSVEFSTREATFGPHADFVRLK